MADKNVFEIKEGVEISHEVVAIVAGLAATEVDGVEALSGNITNALIPKTGAARLSKCVSISENEEGSISIRLSLMIRYGFEIPTISGKVQEKVKSAVENMTGIDVRDVDIRIATVVM